MATAYPGGLRKRGGLLDYEDTIQATPRNPFFGGVADLLGQAYKLPEMPRMGVPGLDFVAANRNRLMDLLGVGDVQKTAETMSYGFPVSTGTGMTYRPKEETINAAMAIAPMVAPAARMVGEGAMATGRFVAPKAGLLAENYMQRMGTMPSIVPAEGGGLLGPAMPAMPTMPVMPIKPVAEVSPLGFYSAVEQQALNIPRKSGTGASFLNDLMKGQDVKKYEIEAMGLDQFLAGKPNVTKQEVQDFVQSNRINVQEKQLGASDLASGATQYEKLQLPGGENYREILLTLPDTASKGQQSYIDPHFGEPNLLTHLRVNDRIDADGKKMLLVEEVQSDWHQAGREQGYRTKERKITQEEIQELKKLNAIDTGDRTGQMNERLDELDSLIAGESQGVPDAPFKDTWYQLALKRAIKEAVDKGYDRIGLTTGSQQASRYDLSKQLTDITYYKTKSGDIEFTASDLEGGFVIEQTVSPEKLSDFVGKEMAQKMINNEGAKDKYDKNIRHLEGLDLQVGGEGMKKYYDEIYPNFLNKYGKKYGAQVKETQIPTDGKKQEPVRYLDITPEMRKAVQKGQPLASIGSIDTGLLA